MVHTFADQFWDADFNGTAGYDALITRLKEGKKFCDAYTDFMRNRAKLEDDYGKNLIRLAQSTVATDEIGTLRASWDGVKKETEHMGIVHCDFSRKLNDLTERMLKFREIQKNERLKSDEKMKKLQKDKKVAHENVMKAKKTYEQRCREADQSKGAYDAKAKTAFTPKEEERLKKNLAKSKTLSENTDSVYQSSVKVLEDIRVKWQMEMEDTCQHFQTLEEQRIQYLRNELWVFTNLGATLAVDIDEKYEECRLVLERCHLVQDIQLFISTKRTGSEKPASIRYENYYHGSRDSNSLPRTHARHPSTQMFSNPVVSEESGKSVDEGNYSTVNEDFLLAKHAQRVRVNFGYVAQGSQELSLNIGDIIEVLRVEDNEWAIGTLNGRKGAFPLSFTQRI